MGLLDKIKNAIGLPSDEVKEFRDALKQAYDETYSDKLYFRSFDFSNSVVYNETIKKWDVSRKVEFIVYLCRLIRDRTNVAQNQNWTHPDQLEKNIAGDFVHTLLKGNLSLSEQAIQSIYQAFKQSKPNDHKIDLAAWPLSGIFRQIQYSFTDEILPGSMRMILEDIIANNKALHSGNSKDVIKLEDNIRTFLFNASNPENAPKPSYFLGKDQFQNPANALIDKQPVSDKVHWYSLVTQAQKASGGKPSAKFLNEAKKTIDALGSDKFKRVTQEWFGLVISMKEAVITHTANYGGRPYEYTTVEFLDPLNTDTLKGFVWMSSWFYDNNTIQTISKLAERCFKKIPQKGPAAAAIGNACLYTLYASKGLDGMAQLSKLKLKIKQNATVALIEKYINEAAQKLGITGEEVEDLAVDDFKLKDHKITQLFDDYTCVLEITGIGKSTLRWFKADGSEQKTVPQLVKSKFANALKKLKDTQKQIDQTSTVQKERFDRMLRANRLISMEYFVEKYLNHGLLSFVVNNIIFQLQNDNETAQAIYTNGKWIDKNNQVISITNYTHVSLWHPVHSSTAEVREWRQFLMNNQIQQPFKQAYREIYLLTDAEINTRTYSNRMASHILKQHQYVTLAKGRNWKAKLIGAWDGGDDDTAELYLPEYNLKVTYWVNSLNADDAFNETGIWNYVVTDQIRFIQADTNELMELVNVPPVAFSEAMRDVDLFVGVASVGNDPTWRDSGGLPNYRDYWQSYSFGDLSEIAKNRKEILQGLIPRLKIAKVTSIADKFVVVKGKLRTYKIHIGSTNILMEPNDQYLCIVPDRNKTNNTENLFLPFEGDSGLSVIISKAFLLADDDKITDSTITSQIHR